MKYCLGAAEVLARFGMHMELAAIAIGATKSARKLCYKFHHVQYKYDMRSYIYHVARAAFDRCDFAAVDFVRKAFPESLDFVMRGKRKRATDFGSCETVYELCSARTPDGQRMRRATIRALRVPKAFYIKTMVAACERADEDMFVAYSTGDDVYTRFRNSCFEDVDPRTQLRRVMTAACVGGSMAIVGKLTENWHSYLGTVEKFLDGVEQPYTAFACICQDEGVSAETISRVVALWKVALVRDKLQLASAVRACWRYGTLASMDAVVHGLELTAEDAYELCIRQNKRRSEIPEEKNAAMMDWLTKTFPTIGDIALRRPPTKKRKTGP